MIRFSPSGDSAFLLTFSDEISEETQNAIRSYLQLLITHELDGITHYLPSYNALLVNYDPLKIEYREVLEHLKSLEKEVESTPPNKSEPIKIPVNYAHSGDHDFQTVCDHTGYNREEVILRHTQPCYLVYMLGFTPGFPYLGGLDSTLATPRKTDPKTKIPAGSVGIAGNQTGIYPIESPGGWQIIGRTPLKLFDANSDSPFLLKAGDKLKFYPISQEEFDATNQNH